MMLNIYATTMRIASRTEDPCLQSTPSASCLRTALSRAHPVPATSPRRVSEAPAPVSGRVPIVGRKP